MLCRTLAGGRGVPVAAPVQAPPASSAASSSFSRMLGNERDGNSGGGGGGGVWRRSSGSKGDKDDEWELERRARIEKVRAACKTTATAVYTSEADVF